MYRWPSRLSKRLPRRRNPAQSIQSKPWQAIRRCKSHSECELVSFKTQTVDVILQRRGNEVSRQLYDLVRLCRHLSALTSGVWERRFLAMACIDVSVSAETRLVGQQCVVCHQQITQSQLAGSLVFVSQGTGERGSELPCHRQCFDEMRTTA